MKAYAAALVAAQRDMPKIAKDATADTGKFSYGYATLDGILEKVLPVLNNHGLALSQSLGFNENGYALTTSLVHESGEESHSVTRLPVDPGTHPGTSPQALGSAVTYMRRYAILSVLALAPGDDDDGAAAQRPVRDSVPVGDPTAAGPSTAKQREDHDKLLKRLAVLWKEDAVRDGEGAPNPWDEAKQYILEAYGATSRQDLTVEEMDALTLRTKGMIDEQEVPFG